MIVCHCQGITDRDVHVATDRVRCALASRPGNRRNVIWLLTTRPGRVILKGVSIADVLVILLARPSLKS